MADTNLHTAEPRPKPALHEDLRRMADEAGRMEDALRGVAGVLKAVCYGGLLDSLPKDEEDWPSHEAATGMLRMVENHVRDILDAERDWDLSCELVLLSDKAKDGRLIRYGKVIPE